MITRVERESAVVLPLFKYELFLRDYAPDDSLVNALFMASVARIES